MGSELEYQDLVYFGYDWTDNERSNQKIEDKFISDIKDKFKNVKLVDAYDQIKGFRQEIYLEKSDSDNYYAWIIAEGWKGCSLTLSLASLAVATDVKQKEFIDRIILLAKEQYPDNFVHPPIIKRTEE